ncbi:PLD nuclease N-terminal domain-containing protein [Rhodococcus gannanensis]|uniref:PLD nuclease N-terminal domain-containing protein n=1 Tax=Rhodococcus gannanensis TaxID=1960308 RepID=A0ABW4P5H2_9NOCA
MDIEPTVPIGVDIALAAMVVAWAILTVTAVVSVLRADHDRWGGKFWWSALVVALPILGALAWFAFGARRREPVR